jgi:hypothetical protein
MSVTNLKVERYRELDQECFAISRRERGCFPIGLGGRVVRDPLIVVHCDKHPSASSDPGEGGKLAGLRKVSCRLLFVAE